MDKMRVGVLISGSGSNLQALMDACADASFPAEIAVVISNRPEAYGLERARAAGIPALVLSHREFATREQYDAGLHRLLERHRVDAVCLAGFMRLLSAEFVTRWHDRLLNIHPSLLPAFKGAHAIRDALAAGVKLAGCTVHFVRAEMDAGPIIAQAAVPVLPGDTESSLAARVLEQEHRAYVQALRWFAEGRLTLVNEKVEISP
jgi:phosphoribosylglycinamide formyltransferase-1